jgi:ADP-dependent NAD(P)H-hydrate dehydratase / NAD(P)H-hydrate epimerase
MQSLPRELWTAAQVRELDRRAIEIHGIPGRELMERAGAAALEALLQRWPASRARDGRPAARATTRATATCSRGWRGARGLAVHLLAVSPPERLRGDAAAGVAGFC